MPQKFIISACAAMLWGLSLPFAAHAQNSMADITQSHVDGNAPSPAAFDKLLRRDLVAYFQGQAGRKTDKVTVTYDYLRRGATQSGVSYPKYYLWVTVRRNGKLSEQGAVRVAASNRTGFEVMQFLSQARLRKAPDAAALVFPAALLEKLHDYVIRARP